MLSFHWTIRDIPRRRRMMEAKLMTVYMALEVRENDDASVTVCGDRRMRSLNLQHRGIVGTPDVLAFPCDEPRVLPGRGAGSIRLAPPERGAPRLLGDVFVNLRQVERQARANGNPPEDEFIAVAIHGLLPLLGMAHARAQDAERLIG